MKKSTKIIVSILVFILLVIGYEYAVYLWSLKQTTPVIRVDIVMIYPIIIGLSFLTYYLLGKIKKYI